MESSESEDYRDQAGLPLHLAGKLENVILDGLGIIGPLANGNPEEHVLLPWTLEYTRLSVAEHRPLLSGDNIVL